jgi:hypothetical protein
MRAVVVLAGVLGSLLFSAPLFGVSLRDCGGLDPALEGFGAAVGSARDVVSDESTGLAYVASGEFGLAVVDLRRPEAPEVIGTADVPFYGEYVTVSSRLAVVSASSLGMTVLDLSDLSRPAVVAHVNGTVKSVELVGKLAYALLLIPGNPAHTELTVFDLSIPQEPRVLGAVTISGGSDLQVIDGLAYVAGGAGLLIIDVSQPSRPTIRGEASVSGGAWAVAVASGYAFVGNGQLVAIIDVSNPDRPDPVGSIALPAMKLASRAGRLYAVAGEVLRIFDIGQPRTPELLSTSNSFNAQGINILGNLALLASPDVSAATGKGGLYVIDVSSPGSPTVLTNIFGGFDNADVAVGSSLGVVAASSLGLKVVDLTDPTAPRPIGWMGGTIKGVVMTDAFAYVLFLVPGNPAHVDLAVVDLRYPDDPVIVGQVTLGVASALQLAGSVVYVAGGPGLLAVNVSNPTRPTIVAEASITSGASALAVADGYAYLGNSTLVSVIDLAAFKVVTTIETPATDIAADSGRLYTIAGSTLKIFDVSSPYAPKLLSSSNSFGAQDIAVMGCVVALATPALSHLDPAGGVYVLDVTDGAHPNLLTQITVPGTTRSITIAGDLVYAGDSAAIMDVISLLPAPGTGFTSTPSPTPTPTWTSVPTATNTYTPPAATQTASSAPTSTPTATKSATITRTATATKTATFTATATKSATATRSATSAATLTLTPTPTPTTGVVPLAGMLTYYRDERPIVAANVALSGPDPLTTTSQISGTYTCPAATGDSWRVEPSKTGDLNSAVSSLDASYILQYVVQKRTFDEFQLAACDISGDGTVSSVDASLLMQYLVGKLGRLPVAAACDSDWAFVPDPAVVPNQELIAPSVTRSVCQRGAVAYNPLLGQADNQNFHGVLFGDCTGNWAPAGGAGAAMVSRTSAQPVVQLGRMRRGRGQRVQVPLYVQTDTPFMALDAQFHYDPSRLRPVGLRSARPLSGALTAFNAVNGELIVSFASPDAVPTNPGPVLVLEFERTKGTSISGAVSPVQLRLDDGAFFPVQRKVR